MRSTKEVLLHDDRALGATINSSACPESGLILKNSTGEISSGMSTYTNLLNCEWTIAPTGATSVTLRFLAFDTAPGDTVAIYECGNSSCSPGSQTLLALASGAVLPPDASAPTGVLRVVFSSDARLAAAGFRAAYAAPCPALSFRPRFEAPCAPCRAACPQGKRLLGACEPGASADTTSCACPPGSFDGGDPDAPCALCGVSCPPGEPPRRLARTGRAEGRGAGSH